MQPNQIVWEPEMNESVYADLKRELARFPYLSDENRTDEIIDKTIWNLFNAPTSMMVEYTQGYVGFRNIGMVGSKRQADVFWIHRYGQPFGPGLVKTARTLFDEAMNMFDYLTMKTASKGLVKLAERVGFKVDRTDPKGFKWNGEVIPMHHMIKEN